MERMTVKEAAKELKMDADCLRWMMLHDKIHIGQVIKRDTRATYYIYREWLEDFKKGKLI